MQPEKHLQTLSVYISVCQMFFCNLNILRINQNTLFPWKLDEFVFFNFTSNHDKIWENQ